MITDFLVKCRNVFIPPMLQSFRLYECHNILTKHDRENGLLRSTTYVWVEQHFYWKEPIVVAEVTVEWFDRWKWIGCHDLEVNELYRGYGIGDEVVEFIKGKGVTHLSVMPDNNVAINLYTKHGFFFTGESDGSAMRMGLMS